MGLNFGNIVNAVNLDWEDGSNNTAGIGQNVYYTAFKDVATLPMTLVTDPNQVAAYELEDLVTVSDDIVMKPGKQLTRLYSTLEEGELKSSLQGPRDGKSFKLSLETYFPGSKKQFHGFRTWVKNNSGLFLVPDMDGNVYIFGSKCYPANLTGGEWGTGKKGDDRKGGNLMFDFNSPRSVTFFTGTIKLFDDMSVSVADQELVYCD